MPWIHNLLTWFAHSHRTLPWRSEPTPYRVIVSEFMLQQTQVATVLPYFERFMTRFPTLSALAAAPVDDVLKLWEGLGYYSRARRLHQCAQLIAARPDGFPQTPEALMALPGIGPYTAAAIASIAFNKQYPVVDGNVLRIHARMTADATPLSDASLKKRVYAHLLDAIRGTDQPSAFNQAMMELGALVCHPATPHCADCPVRADCQAYASGSPTDFPSHPEKLPVPHYHVAVGLVYHGDTFLITKRSDDQMLGGLWEFPGGKLEDGETPQQAVVREVKEETGLEVSCQQELAVIKHAYSHFKITMHAFRCELRSPLSALAIDRPYHWITASQIPQFAFPKANHKIFDIISNQPQNTQKTAQKPHKKATKTSQKSPQK